MSEKEAKNDIKKMSDEEFLRWKRRKKILSHSTDRMNLICGESNGSINPQPPQTPPSTLETKNVSTTTTDSTNIISSQGNKQIPNVLLSTVTSHESFQFESIHSCTPDPKHVFSQEKPLNQTISYLRKVTQLLVICLAVFLALDLTCLNSRLSFLPVNVSPLLILLTVEFAFGLIGFFLQRNQSHKVKIENVPSTKLLPTETTTTTTTPTTQTSTLQRCAFHFVAILIMTLLDLSLFLFWFIFTISFVRVVVPLSK
jgi:hypothetical protein